MDADDVPTAPDPVASPVSRRAAFAAVLVVAVMALVLEAAFVRVWAYKVVGEHVHLALGVAQLGFAAAGASVASRGRRTSSADLRGAFADVGLYAVLFLGLQMALAMTTTLGFAKIHGPTAWMYLGGTGLVAAGLFFRLGLVAAGLLTDHRDVFSRLYAVDLVGAGLGAMGAVGLLYAVGPLASIGLVAVTAAGASLWFHRALGARTLPPLQVLVLVAGGAIAVMPRLADPGWSASAPSISVAWTHLGRVDRVNPSFYVFDGDTFTRSTVEGESAWPVDLPMTLAAPSPRVLVVGAGAGSEVLQALRAGASEVVALERDPVVVRWTLDKDAAKVDDVYRDPRVRVVVDDARHWAKANRGVEAFDLVIVHGLTTRAPGIRAPHAFDEQHVLTAEGLRDVWPLVKPGGFVSVRDNLDPLTRWADLRATAVTALDGDGDLALLLPTPDPWEEARLSPWLLVAPHGGFRSGFSELLRGEVAARSLRVWSATGLEPTFDPALEDHVPQVFTDDLPFDRAGMGWFTGVHGAGAATLRVGGGVLCLGALALVVVVARRVPGAPPWRLAAFAAASSAGFMTAEVAMVHAMGLGLGSTAAGFAVATGGALVASGLVVRGAGTGGHPALRALLCAATLVPAWAAAQAVPMGSLVASFSGPSRVLLATFIVAGVFLPSGLPLPAAIARVEGAAPTAWVWLGSAAGGVIGTALAGALVVTLGIQATFGVACAAYVVAAGLGAAAIRA